MHLPFAEIEFDEIHSTFIEEAGVSLSMMRLDKIHESVSGNKLFKLHFYIENCLKTNNKTLLTFGGAYSNHLAATAFLCKIKNIKCIGIVRGLEPKILSHTLEFCKANGMILEFIDNETYKNASDKTFEKSLETKYGEFTLVPEGGYGMEGAKGASIIMDLLKNKNATHVCTSVGTATTLAGLLMNCDFVEKIIAIPAIKNMHDIEERLNELGVNFKREKLEIFPEYHFGGYAKHTPELINFMNIFFIENNIPLDFIYTAKMMFGIYSKIKTGYFARGSNIICLHTGGLQGNLSFAKDTLFF